MKASRTKRSRLHKGFSTIKLTLSNGMRNVCLKCKAGSQ